MLVMSIHSVNALLGFASVSWPAAFDPMTVFKVYGKMIMLAVRGIVTAACISLVEELLFRSWLPEEIATDLGYNRGIIISGLAFSLFQRYVFYLPIWSFIWHSAVCVQSLFFCFFLLLLLPPFISTQEKERVEKCLVLRYGI